MVTELQRKMGGWIVEAVAPALIMLMTGSLAFFMVELFYYGSTEARVKWVLGLFVFASVLVSRISIQEGFDKAILYGLILGAATIFVLQQLTEVSLLLSFAFIGVIWWFNSKLTWDCTVIDNSKDTTDRGLLQRLGVASDEMNSEDEESDLETEELGTTSTEEQPNAKEKPAWTQRFFSRKKRPNTPGVWVLYLSLAAFPIYGFGQGFISDEIRRQNAFFDFCLYMVGGLGLLVTTAMMGLQRYLIRRNASMPNGVAISWVGFGIAMIVAILVAAWILPRPNSEYSFAENPFKITRQSEWGSSRNSVGSDGKDDGQSSGQKDSRSQNQTGSGQSETKGGMKSGNKKSQSNSQSQSKSDGGQSGKKSSSKKSKGGRSRTGDRGKSPSDSKDNRGSKNDRESPANSGQKNNSPGASGKEKSSKNQPKSNQEASGSQSSDQKKEGSSDSKQMKDDPNRKQSSDRSNSGKSNSGKSNAGKSNAGERKSNERKSNERNEQRDENKKRQPNRGGSNSTSTSKRKTGSSENSTQKSASPQKSSFKMPSLGNISWVFQMLLWIAILVVACFFGWKYRRQLWESWLKFLEDLKNFWSNLFRKQGRHQSTNAAPQSTESPVAKPTRPFASYRNPFENGLYQQMSQVELIRYSFEALEAWGSDRNFSRKSDQTPHEYARGLVELEKPIARQAKKLADFYCAAAYAPGSLNDRTIPLEIEKLWKSLNDPNHGASPGHAF